MTHRPRASLSIVAGLAAALVLVVGTAGGVAATEFPKGWEGFHSYTELTDEIHAVAAAHPDIVSVFSIGKSYKGRELWMAKVSDNVATDEAEPEVFFDGTHHSDEHMGVEMCLKIFHWLVDGYGVDSRITNIVNTREVYILFLANPDGAEYDISGGKFHYWRKNRQPTPGNEVDRDRPQPQLRLQVGPRRPDERQPAGDHLPRSKGRSRPRRRGRSATSWPAASSTGGSRSRPRSRSTRPAAS